MAGDPDDWPVVYAPGAFDQHIGKTVPMTIEGRRVGSATLREDGQFDVVFEDDEQPEIVSPTDLFKP